MSRQLATGIPEYTNESNGISVNNPYSASTANSEKVYKLQSTSGQAVTGLGISLKVMAGDQIDIFGKSYYFDNTTTGTHSPLNIESVIIGLFASGSSMLGTKALTENEMKADGVIASMLGSFLSGPNRGTDDGTSRPKAYINWILFDEQLQVAGGNFSRVAATGTMKNHFSELQGIEVTSNGYLYVYCSNESSKAVFFDNLQVVHTRGPLVEETHYFPFGLTMHGISSKSEGGLENKKEKFQGQEFTHDLGVDIYEFMYRAHDPQIGRFWQVDPLSEKYVHNSTYAFSENKVTSHVELEGLEALSLRDLWGGAGITSSTDPKQFVRQVGNELTKPSTWFEGAAKAGQIAIPFALTEIMTGGWGGASMLRAEMKSVNVGGSAMLLEAKAAPLVEQWGMKGLYSTEGRTTTILGTRQGYWGTIVDNADNIGLNLVANEANPGGFSYLNVNSSEYNFVTAEGRLRFFEQYNKPFLDAAISRGDRLLMLDNPYNANAIFHRGEASQGFNFYGMERSYLESKGFTFSNGQALYPLQSNWHPPMVVPNNQFGNQ